MKSKKISYIPILESPENVFSSFDLGMSAALESIGFKILHIDKKNRSKALFLFENSDEIVEAAQSYWRKELSIDALTYFECMKKIKNQLYSS